MAQSQHFATAAVAGLVTVLVGLAAVLFIENDATPKQKDPEPTHIVAPLRELSTHCTQEMVRRGVLLGVPGEDRVGRPAAAALCGCIANRVGARYQDRRSTAFAERQITALIGSSNRKGRVRWMMRRAQDLARDLGMSHVHRAGLINTMQDSVKTCAADYRDGMMF